MSNQLGTNLAEVGTDCISREQAIDALERAKQNIHHNIERAIGDAICEVLDTVESGIKQLPPIQPVNNSEVPNSSDCISRQDALEAFGLSEKTRKYGGDHSGYDTMMMYEIQDTIEDLPPIHPEPQYKTNYGFMWLCPKCGLPIHSDYTRCVRCGHNREKGV